MSIPVSVTNHACKVLGTRLDQVTSVMDLHFGGTLEKVEELVMSCRT